MILSTNFLKDYLDLKEYDFDNEADIIKLADQMTLLGNEYDSASKLINATNLTIGEVVECEMHPDSDHLHVCKVNIGGGKIEQIVCGAPNVRKGLKVIVALPGAKLPEIEIKRGVIRGVESNGMLCSMAELGLDKKFLSEKDVAGIHELDDKAIPGEDPIKYLKLDDGVIDFDLTANRGDLLSVLGMAYEVGALTGKKVKDIDLEHKESKEDFSKNFKIKIDTENCKIYLAKRVDNVVIKESPQEIKEKLIACGIRPINNVVDISNYVMMETGQPLHFFDADKLNGMIQVRMAKEGEKITTLDSKERVLSEEDIVISDGKNPIALAGVMGGLDTEITEETKNVVIESAIFDSVHIRKTSNKILRSESSNRFEKGLDPNRTYMAIERACKLLEEYAGGSVQKGTCVYDKADKDDKKIEITVANICNILGTVIPEKEIISIFKKLGLKLISNINPTYMHDDVFIAGLPYYPASHSKALKSKLAELSKKANDHEKSILVMHQGIGKYFGYQYELEIDEIPDNFNYYAMGHIHKYVNDNYGKGKLVYPGSGEIWKTSELPDYRENGKGFVLVDLDGPKPHIKRVKIDISRQFIKRSLDYNDLESGVLGIKETIQNLDKKPILDLEINNIEHDTSGVYDVINRELGDLSLMIRPHFNTIDEDISANIVDSDSSVSIKAIIANKLEGYGNKEISELATDLFDLLSRNKNDESKELADQFYEEFYKNSNDDVEFVTEKVEKEQPPKEEPEDVQVTFKEVLE